LRFPAAAESGGGCEQRSPEQSWLDRLGHVIVHSGRQARRPIFAQCIAGQGNDLRGTGALRWRRIRHVASNPSSSVIGTSIRTRTKRARCWPEPLRARSPPPRSARYAGDRPDRGPSQLVAVLSCCCVVTKSLASVVMPYQRTIRPCLSRACFSRGVDTVRRCRFALSRASMRSRCLCARHTAGKPGPKDWGRIARFDSVQRHDRWGVTRFHTSWQWGEASESCFGKCAPQM
jgi:hypothetical protein